MIDDSAQTDSQPNVHVLASTSKCAFTLREQMMALNSALTPKGTSLGELMTIRADILALKKAL